MNAAGIRESVDEFEKAIAQSQIIMFLADSQAGDEPDGSAKFFATAFRNAKMKEAVHETSTMSVTVLHLVSVTVSRHLSSLDLFQTEQLQVRMQQSPTLTFNTINRHISKMVYTKVV